MRILGGILIMVLIAAVLWRPESPRAPAYLVAMLFLVCVLVLTACAPITPTETTCSKVPWVQR